MYKLIKIKKIEDGFDILLKNKEFKCKLWLTATFKDDDLVFDWKTDSYHLSSVRWIISAMLKKNLNEFTDACASALCYLERRDFITITDDLKILRGRR